MIIYSQNEKRTIGRLFYYYRKKNKIKWNEIKNASISSNTTYSKMEHGNLVLEDALYDKYISFYQEKFERKENFETWLQDYLIRLEPALEYNNVDQLNDLYQEVKTELEPYNTFLIYKQYLQAFNHIFRYYVENSYLTKEEIEDDMLLIETGIFPEVISVYLIEVMFLSNNNSVRDEKIRKEISELNRPINSVILTYIRALNEKCDANFSTALELLNEAYLYWKSVNNSYRMVKCYSGIFIIYKNTDLKKANEMIPQLLIYKNEINLDLKTKRSINYNVGMFYYLNKKYSDAYPLFLENYEQYGQSNVIIYICAVCSRMNIELPVWLNTMNIENLRNEIYLKYFQMKQKSVSNEKLVKYIMRTIVPQKLIHIPWTQPYWKMFEFELQEIIKEESKYYSIYLEYVEKMDKICKDA